VATRRNRDGLLGAGVTPVVEDFGVVALEKLIAGVVVTQMRPRCLASPGVSTMNATSLSGYLASLHAVNYRS
jgi:hypothetical protein